ncbi:MAG TPA: hypothetical protein EYP43_01955, partial [Thermoplasmata archaeon]|nr:hypothetical protein [Thermoplasmata archaeon]
MDRTITMSRWDVAVEGDVLMCARGPERADIPLDAVRSVLWTRVPALPRSALRWGVLLIFMPYVVFVAVVTLMRYADVLAAPAYDAPSAIVIPLLGTALGLGLIMAHTVLRRPALDIATVDGVIILVGPKEYLTRIKGRINAFRTAHGHRDEMAEDALLDGEDGAIYARIEQEGVGAVSLLDDIDACVRCGSLDLRPGAVADGAIPGTFDIQGQVVCGNCGLVAVPLSF